MKCRRCGWIRLIKLDKRSEEDNDVYRCQECGYIFSPGQRFWCTGPASRPVEL